MTGPNVYCLNNSPMIREDNGFIAALSSPSLWALQRKNAELKINICEEIQPAMFPTFSLAQYRVVCSPVEVLIDNVLWCLNVGACFFKVSVPAMLGASRLSFRWFQSQRFSKQFLTFDIIDDDNEVWMVYQDVLDKNNFNQL